MAAIEKLVAGARVTATVKKGKNFEKLHGEVVKFLPNKGVAVVRLENGEKAYYEPEILELRRGRRPGQVVEKTEKPVAKAPVKPGKAPVKPAKVETRKPAKANDDDEDAPKSKNEKLEEFIVKAMMKHMPLILAQILREFADALDDGETMDEDEDANSENDDADADNDDDNDNDEGDGDDGDNDDDGDDNDDDGDDGDNDDDGEDDDAPPPPPARKPGKVVATGKRAPLILGRKR